MRRPRLGIIPGDPSGIGPELIAKLLHASPHMLCILRKRYAFSEITWFFTSDAHSAQAMCFLSKQNAICTQIIRILQKGFAFSTQDIRFLRIL